MFTEDDRDAEKELKEKSISTVSEKARKSAAREVTETVPGTVPIKCRLCGKGVRIKVNLENHMSEEHRMAGEFKESLSH